MKMPNPLRAAPRGQALVLSALGMILLVVLVCMTLSFGTKAKQKMEVQIAADQAAYSTAVATARTYNMLSMVNRVRIAHMTAMLGIQSAISFASSWGQLVRDLQGIYGDELRLQNVLCRQNRQACERAAFVRLNRVPAVQQELDRLRDRFPAADNAAAAQARRTGLANVVLYRGQLETIRTHLFTALSTDPNNRDGIVRRVVDAAGVPSWRVPPRSDRVTRREVGFDLNSVDPRISEAGAIIDRVGEGRDLHMVEAAMGSRGVAFTANRSERAAGIINMVHQGFRRIGVLDDLEAGMVLRGHARYADPTDVFRPHRHILGKLAISDDHLDGSIRVAYPAALANPLPPQRGFSTFSSVTSSNASADSSHRDPGGFGRADHMVVANCAPNCPSAWTNFADYNPALVDDPDDNFAQPKAPTTIINGSSKRDPFNLLFRLRFTPDGQGFNMQKGTTEGGGQLNVRDGPGSTDISAQLGYSTGITYYHRRGHWKEPPNLFNPFWRAGLTRADTDRAAVRFRGNRDSPDNRGDIEDTMRNSEAGWAADAYCALYRVDYQGINVCP